MIRAFLSLLVANVPEVKGFKPTRKDIESMFTPAELPGYLPAEAKYIEGKQIVLEGEPGGMVVADMIQGRLDSRFYMRMLSFLVFYKNQLITIQFSVMNTEDQKLQTIREFNEMRPLFMMIANSLILRDKYK